MRHCTHWSRLPTLWKLHLASTLIKMTVACYFPKDLFPNWLPYTSCLFMVLFIVFVLFPKSTILQTLSQLPDSSLKPLSWCNSGEKILFSTISTNSDLVKRISATPNKWKDFFPQWDMQKKQNPEKPRKLFFQYPTSNWPLALVTQLSTLSLFMKKKIWKITNTWS